MRNVQFLLVTFVLITSKLYSQGLPASIPKEVDLGVSGIMLYDTSNVKMILGLSDELFEDLLDAYFPPHFNYVNQDTSELLVLLFHPGSYRYEFAEFKILKLPEKFSERFNVLSNVKIFTTYKGLSLGISIDEFRNIFGNGFVKETNNGEIILTYTLVGEDPDYLNNQFLEFYSSYFYYGHYTFLKNKLIKIEFGFEYP
jgi:hypothetical protein